MSFVTERDKARIAKHLDKTATRRVQIRRGDVYSPDLDSDPQLWAGKANRVSPRLTSTGLQEGARYDNTAYAYSYQLVEYVEIDTETHYLVDITRDADNGEVWELLDETHGAFDLSTFVRVRDVT